MKRPSIFFCSAISFLLVDCGGVTSNSSPEDPAKTDSATPLLVEVPTAHSGITFANNLNENGELNYATYPYVYAGGGVAIGDINSDGLPDVYLTGNMVPDRLYLNKGGLKFEDITDRALPPRSKGWHTGVTMADVNADGWMDIYVSRAGPTRDANQRANLLFMNNGDLTFTENARAMGVGDTMRTTQASFFDYDKDGDLDLYVLNHPHEYLGDPEPVDEEIQKRIREGTAESDHLYRNDAGHFSDVSLTAGISDYAYGLGLFTGDINDDGWPDIYVANDYFVQDFIYINQGDGTFLDHGNKVMRHTSTFAMGCDVADFNNDAYPDIMVLDMVSEDHIRSKKNMPRMSSDKFWADMKFTGQYQYMVNTLQLNNGNGTFSEIGQLAGVARTDWSWAPLFCDLDNDGWKDLVVTNGLRKDVMDQDFGAIIGRIDQATPESPVLDLIAQWPATTIPNYIFKNNGDLTFSDASSAWGFSRPVNSNGLAYADLDLDGDLDVVINNQDALTQVFENRAVQQARGHFIRVAVKGASTAVGANAKVWVTTEDGTQYQEIVATRGYESSVEPVAHFGLGKVPLVKEIKVTWPDGMVSRMTNVHADQVLMVERASAVREPGTQKPLPALDEVAYKIGLDMMHIERSYDDFRREVLLPHKESENGPFLSKGDADGDGTIDVFIGGARGQSSVLFLQQENGTFKEAPSQPWRMHKESETMGSLFFDADGDKDMDLYMVTGSNEMDQRPERYQDWLYINQGNGAFAYSPDALPSMITSGSRVVAGDIDADGDLDLFVGGRIIPGLYPVAPRSYLLENNGTGTFHDATEERAPDLRQPGLVTDAEFVDVDQDLDLDLVVVGEWMPVMVMRNDGAGHFSNATSDAGTQATSGWWFSLAAADIDGDGDQDLIGGNLGWNSKFKGRPGHPNHLYFADFDENGHPDIVLAKDYNNMQVPVRGRECSSQQMPAIKERFPTYDAFARASIEQIYTPEKLEKALHLQAEHMWSSVLMNDSHGHFEAHPLPMQAQIAPTMGIATADLNEDGHMDLILVGNYWGAEVETVRYDAGNGLVLLGDGTGEFSPIPAHESGFAATLNARDVVIVPTTPGHEPLILVANNNGPLQAFAATNGSSRSRLRSPAQADGHRVSSDGGHD